MESYLICRSLVNFNIKSSIKKPLVFDASGVDTFAGHLLPAFPHFSEAFSQQYQQLLAFLTALSSSPVSLLTQHQQHQPELLLSTLCDIRRSPGSNIGALLIFRSSPGASSTTTAGAGPPGSKIGALLGVALLLSALCDIRRSPGSNIGARLRVALSSSSVSLPKYLEHRLDSYSSTPKRYTLSFSTFLTFDFLPLYILNAYIDCPPNIWSDHHQPIRNRTTTLLKVLTSNFSNYDRVPARPLTY